MLCTTIKKEKFEELYASVQKYPFVEIRFDDFNYTEDEIYNIISIRNVKKIATIRNTQKDDERKLSDFMIVAEAGCDFIDVEHNYKFLDKAFLMVSVYDSKGIYSYHNFEGFPELKFIEDIAKDAYAHKADYLKIACKCNNISDYTNLISLYSNSVINDLFPGRLIAAPMGEQWKLHRLSLLKLGSPFIYVSENDSLPVVEGQIEHKLAANILEQIK